jgi:hypothetical protein
MTISLGRALPSASMRCGSFGRAVHTIERSCFRWGLPERASPRDSVSSYLTISPLRGFRGAHAVCFCGTFLRVAPTGRYPAPCPMKPGLSSLPKRLTSFGGPVVLRGAPVLRTCAPPTGRAGGAPILNHSMGARSSSVLRAVSIPPLDDLSRIDQAGPGAT